MQRPITLTEQNAPQVLRRFLDWLGKAEIIERSSRCNVSSRLRVVFIWRSGSNQKTGGGHSCDKRWTWTVGACDCPVLAIIGKRIFLDFRRPATGHANLVSGVGSAEMDRSSG